MTTTATKERPILLSGPMVRAILEGRKTQTRRTYKLQKDMEWYQDLGGEAEGWYTNGIGWWNVEEEVCPYGKPGDCLWVREAWAPLVVGNENDYLYRADHHTGLEKRDGDQKWKRSIHMPRIACRLMLEITGVRIERLQEISEEDATAEGVSANESWSVPWWQGYKQWGDQLVHQVVQGHSPPEWMIEPKPSQPTDHLSTTARDEYRVLWGNINGPLSWATNPWVWVVEFKRIG